MPPTFASERRGKRRGNRNMAHANTNPRRHGGRRKQSIMELLGAAPPAAEPPAPKRKPRIITREARAGRAVIRGRLAKMKNWQKSTIFGVDVRRRPVGSEGWYVLDAKGNFVGVAVTTIENMVGRVWELAKKRGTVPAEYQPQVSTEVLQKIDRIMEDFESPKTLDDWARVVKVDRAGNPVTDTKGRLAPKPKGGASE